MSNRLGFYSNHIDNAIKIKLKKISIEGGLLAIKFISLSGRFVAAIINSFFLAIKLILKLIFYRPLIKLYYGIFRLKKNEMAEGTFKDFLRKKLAVLVIFIIFVFILATNLATGEVGIKAANAKLSKTTVSSLILSDFDTRIEEELIEETLDEAYIASLKNETNKNEDNFVEKPDSLNNYDEELKSDYIVLNSESDTVLKPEMIFSTNNSLDPQRRTEIIEYIVQSGDTISSIARNFGLTVNTVLWSNNLGSYSLIRPGDTLSILPASGLLYTVKSGDTLSRIAKTYGITDSEILKQNNLDISSGLKIGQNLILPGAKKITVSSVAKTSNTTNTTSNTSATKVAPAKSNGGDMVWPTDGHRITQYFSWRHNGLDIGNKIGTPIYAADAGTIEVSQGGWNGGYGNTILINHGNGKKTRYGHLSVLYVKAGDKVERGENIGTMGSTGRSTGPHLHFEVVINGTRYNPLNYIK